MSNWIATCALLVGVTGLWLQHRSLRLHLTVQNFAHYNERYQNIVMDLPAAVLEPDFDLAALPESDRVQVLKTLWRYFDLCLEEYQLHDHGLISDAVWRTWRSAIESAMRRPAFRQGWAIVHKLTSYDRHDGFTAMIQEMAVG